MGWANTFQKFKAHDPWGMSQTVPPVTLSNSRLFLTWWTLCVCLQNLPLLQSSCLLLQGSIATIYLSFLTMHRRRFATEIKWFHQLNTGKRINNRNQVCERTEVAFAGGERICQNWPNCQRSVPSDECQNIRGVAVHLSEGRWFDSPVSAIYMLSLGNTLIAMKWLHYCS